MKLESGCTRETMLRGERGFYYGAGEALIVRMCHRPAIVANGRHGGPSALTGCHPYGGGNARREIACAGNSPPSRRIIKKVSVTIINRRRAADEREAENNDIMAIIYLRRRVRNLEHRPESIRNRASIALLSIRAHMKSASCLLTKPKLKRVAPASSISAIRLRAVSLSKRRGWRRY